jgi:hypothetical protein
MGNVAIFIAGFVLIGILVNLPRQDIRLILGIGITLVLISASLIVASSVVGGLTYTLADLLLVRKFPMGSLGFYLGYGAIFMGLGSACRLIIRKRR